MARSSIQSFDNDRDVILSVQNVIEHSHGISVKLRIFSSKTPILVYNVRL